MIARQLALTAALFAIAGSAHAQSAGGSISSLIGAWEVVGVKLRPGRVQALRENDPEYMGAILDISLERMQWRPHAGGTLDEVCNSPLIVDEFIKCSGKFGPPGVVLAVKDGGLLFRWYDNGDLFLQRKR